MQLIVLLYLSYAFDITDNTNEYLRWKIDGHFVLNDKSRDGLNSIAGHQYTVIFR